MTTPTTITCPDNPPTADLADVLDTVHDAVAWLNSHHGPDDTELTMRVLKVAEEVGEAAQAWIGATGQNPRKGVTHTRADVAAELADVVLSALVAITSLGLDPAAAVRAKAAVVATRLHCRNQNHEITKEAA